MTDLIRIGIISPCPPPYGGVTRVVGNNVAGWVNEPVESHFVPLHVPGEAEPPAGAEFHRLMDQGERSRKGIGAFIRSLASAPMTRPSVYRSFVGYNQALSRFIDEHKLDVIYAHGVWPAGASAVLQSRIHDVASVVVAYGETYGTTSQHRRWARSARSVCKGADHVIAPSEHCMNGAIQKGADRSRSSVVYAGVDIGRFRPGIDGRPWREAHGVPADAFVVSVLGLVLQRKIEVFLDAVAKTATNNIVFLIGGRGPDEAYVRSRLNGTAGNPVRVLGFVKEDELPEFYAASNVLIVSPNTKLECMGQSMKEAMACGTAVIGANIGGIPEAIEHGVGGLMYDPNDPAELANAIDRLASDAGLRRSIGTRSRDVAVERFDATVSAARTLEGIRTAIAYRRSIRNSRGTR